MTNYYVNYSDKPSDKEIEILTQGILNDSKKRGYFGLYEKFSLILRDSENIFCGGCYGFIFYGSLHIDKLFIIEDLRNQGLGTKLIYETEKLARKKNCKFITVNTMNWQAGSFYLKNKFECEFTRKGYNKGCSLTWYRKEL